MQAPLLLLGGQFYNPSSSLERVLSAPAPRQRAVVPPVSPSINGRLGNGEVKRAVIKVLTVADGPMRGTDIHRAVERLRGHPVSKNSVDWCLAAGVRGSHPPFERISYGVYRLKS